jgi:predicted nucleic acid-binding protein
VTLIDDRFPAVLTLSPRVASRVHRILVSAGVLGGAVYDGLVALAAKESGAVLATRDARAAGTYRSVGVDFEFLEDPPAPQS